MKKLSHAYTLIEILVSLTIIGLLFSVGYANFRSFSQRQAVLNTAKSVQGDLSLAQEAALAGTKPDDCKAAGKSLDGYNFKVVSATEYTISAKCGSTVVVTKDVNLSSGASFASPFPSPNPIVFNVLGNGTNISDSQDAVIKISQTGTSNLSTITINSAGQIQ